MTPWARSVYRGAFFHKYPAARDLLVNFQQEMYHMDETSRGKLGQLPSNLFIDVHSQPGTDV